MALLIPKKITIPTKYTGFAHIFSKKLAEILPEKISINKQSIKLVDGKLLPYMLIYSLVPIKLETLKTYIKTNLANGFIHSSKFSIRATIVFV